MRSLTTLEPKKHGDSLFPFEVYHLTYPKNSIILDLHWHAEFELLIVTEGVGIFQLDESEYVVKKNQAILINGGILHRARTQINCNCSFIALVFDPRLISGSNNDLIKIKYIDPVLDSLKYIEPILKNEEIIEIEILKCLLDISSTAQAKKRAYEIQIKMKLLNVFYLFIQMIETRSINENRVVLDNKSNNIKESLLYIHKNYNKSLTLDDISASAGMSKAYFCRTFKNLVDKTVFEYLNFYRISISTSLLKETNKTISIISEEVGYESSSYFTKQFKKITSTTPNVYRTTYKK